MDEEEYIQLQTLLAKFRVVAMGSSLEPKVHQQK